MLRRKRAFQQHPSLRRDLENQGIIPSPLISRFMRKLKSFSSVPFWDGIFGRTEDEKLVDTDLLSYSYLEMGMIESLGT